MSGDGGGRKVGEKGSVDEAGGRARGGTAKTAKDDKPRVYHKTYGEGTVLKVERGGMSLRVLFDRFPGLDISMPARLLRRIGGAGVVREPRPSTLRPPSDPAEVLALRQTIEALRLGVVPTRDLSAYTVGRDTEVEQFRLMLSDGSRGRALALLGDYGCGKTHMLEIMQGIALADGWVVGRAWLDPQEAPPSQPRRVYHALARSLAYPETVEAGEQGLLPLLESCEGLSLDDGTAHLFLDPAVRYARALAERIQQDPGSLELGELQALMLDWIEGRATGLSQELGRKLSRALKYKGKVYALSDFRTLAKVYGYMLSGLAALARRSGRRGLLLLLDETELFSSLNKEARAQAAIVFRVLIAAALPAGGEESIDLDDVEGGGHGAIRNLPPRFGKVSHLALCLAATPGSASEDFLRNTLGDKRVLELLPLMRKDFVLLSQRIRALYARAYPETPPRALSALEDKVDSWLSRGLPGSPREFGRKVVDFLDFCRHTHLDFAG
ncbi:MAG TPA: hypothetical protein ENK02_14505 [Planctomycetes bacterium]|nr:hypothetical protein [Planctomycetota bacterium]